MWTSLILYTLLVIGLMILQGRYWRKMNKKRESMVFLVGMLVAWIIGVLFLTGVELPNPTRPILPQWQ